MEYVLFVMMVVYRDHGSNASLDLKMQEFGSKSTCEAAAKHVQESDERFEKYQKNVHEVWCERK